MKIYGQISELVGNTPIAELKNIERAYGLKARLLAKLEYLNPAGSVKDRIAKAMIEDAEQRGILKKGGVIIEPTSGNTGIGLAAIGVSKGYRVILTMPDTMSAERRSLFKFYGAEAVLTDGKLGMKGAIAKAEELNKEIAGSIVAGQFFNPSNPAAHYRTTGAEIWNDTDGNVDILVASVGSGGTITGTGRFLKEKNKNIQVVAVEPLNSPFISKGVAGAHKIQGIGAGFIPDNLDLSVIDKVVPVADEDAFSVSRALGSLEGYLTGISSGAALWAAIHEAQLPENNGKTIAVILPDSGDRYLSTELFK